ncbi:MAG TPA: hypothetical protein PK175_10940 [Syntrophales bacterium]|nr:hypothetical protein [Syntrophales bacterium]HON22927.1 hypothetical protein [Syntrophales bacterium]HOU77499.1 hypothetical protein [Syntrophales bacterium]HPC31923.1 hypothetical protein [Syntrophales bacterium]HQG35380.1 hypothetical protein [Syntrophales bacterium]
MANLQIKGLNNDFYARIKELAGAENRSVSQQIVYMTKDYLAKREQIQSMKTSGKILLDLAGSWQDDRTADEIILDLKQSRTITTRQREGF